MSEWGEILAELVPILVILTQLGFEWLYLWRKESLGEIKRTPACNSHLCSTALCEAAGFVSLNFLSGGSVFDQKLI